MKSVGLRFVRNVNSQVRFDESAACATCGQFGAYEFDGSRLCADCYAARGACCAEASHEPHWACRGVESDEKTAKA